MDFPLHPYKWGIFCSLSIRLTQGHYVSKIIPLPVLESTCSFTHHYTALTDEKGIIPPQKPGDTTTRGKNMIEMSSFYSYL
jgi:hypothetical protein